MAKTPPPQTPAQGRATDVAQKAGAVAKKVAGLRADLGLAHGLAHEAQIREALTRTELTLALGEALKGRAEALAAARRLAVQRHLEVAAPCPVRRRGRLQRGF